MFFIATKFDVSSFNLKYLFTRTLKVMSAFNSVCVGCVRVEVDVLV